MSMRAALPSMPPHLREVCVILARGVPRLRMADGGDAAADDAGGVELGTAGAGSTGLSAPAERVSHQFSTGPRPR
jgi:hypothetical protein